MAGYIGMNRVPLGRNGASLQILWHVVPTYLSGQQTQLIENLLDFLKRQAVLFPIEPHLLVLATHP